MGAVLFTLACQPQPAALTDTDRDAIRASLDAFTDAALAQDWDAIVALYTEDAVLMPPNGPAVTGHAEIRDSWVAFPPLSAIHAEMVEIEGVGDLAYVRGTYHIVMDVEGSPEDTGKFLEIRRRQDDGAWLIVRDIYNSDVPLPEPDGM
ncbi:MAG: DUF4440 domain-containing protein [Gemmatimonadales bacterium]